MTQQKTNIGIILTENAAQSNFYTQQISIIAGRRDLYLQQLEKLFVEYLAAAKQYQNMVLQLPVNFLTDGKLIKGYNKDGDFVALYDAYENYAVIEYEEYFDEEGAKRRISRLYDNKENVVQFSYNDIDQLSAITDIGGRKTSYIYDGDNLQSIRYDSGEKQTISYLNGNITSVTEEKSGLKTEIGYANNRPTFIKHDSTVDNIALENTERDKDLQISMTQINYYPVGSNSIIYVTVTENLRQERYYFDDWDNCTEYRLEENGLVTQAEKYTHHPYWIGDEKQSDPKEVVIQATKTSLYKTALDSYLFFPGDTETTLIDQFNNPTQTTTNAIIIAKWTESDGTVQQNTQTTKTEYTYDDEQRLIEEKRTTVFSNPSKTIISYKKYNYNMYGEIVRTESYIEGEELITGKTIEETEYDERGNAVRSFTCNSLDSSSKFYTESEVAENGQTLADYDETGEHKTEYEYISGTEVVRAQKLPNGSKFAYGHDADDRVTSISQSTEEGEENSTQTRYTCGEVTELVSGNNTVRYTYDGKRRVSGIELNGAEYVTIATTDATEEQEETAHVDYIARDEDDKSDRYEITRNKRGDVLSVRYAYESQDVESPAYAELFTNEYDSKHRITQITQGSTVLAENEYDDLDRQTKHTFGTNVHTIEYDEYSQTSKETIRFGGSETDKQEYVYTYDEEKASRPVTGMTVGAFGESYEQDVSGRSVKVAQTLNGNSYTKRYGYYKHGDHATSRVNTVYYGKNGMTDGKVTYTYDSMGNIVSVSENGKQRYVYGYDKLCRLISEKDLYKNKEVCYTYDNNGNILTKRIDGEVTEYKYREGSDRLVQYGAEQFGYDNMGNPTTYRNMTCTWEKGRQLKSVTDGANTATYSYDVFGVRSGKVVGGEETSYVYENGKLLRQVTGDEVLDFYYGSEGVIGFKVSGSTEVANGNYLYRKNLFGDITGIIDESGALVYEYGYSAFGKSDKSEETGIGAKNPFRYRGYYYDEETGLYYLKSRYYDPEVGRFITIDDISYLDPETINGLNLYAYCGNNPVMRVDSNGHEWWNPLTWNWRAIGDFFTKTIPNALKSAANWANNNIVKPVGNFFVDTWNTVKSWDWGKIGMTAGSITLVLGGVAGMAFGGPIGLFIGSLAIGAGFTSMINANINEQAGGSYFAGWIGGLIGGVFDSTIPIIGPALGELLYTVIASSVDNTTIDWARTGINIGAAAIISLLALPLEVFPIYAAFRGLVSSFLMYLFDRR